MGGRRYESYEQGNLLSAKTNVKDRFYNYGSGVKFDVGCQYFMMEDVALQTSFGYSAGFTFEQVESVAGLTTTTTFKRHLFGLKALVVPRFEALDLIDLYAGVGLGFFWNHRPFKIVAETAAGSQEATGKITSRPTFGFIGQLGADYPLNDKLTLFGEFAFEQIRFNLSKRIVKESNYVLLDEDTDHYVKDDADPLDPEKIPGSNFQIRVGIRLAVKNY